MKKTKNEISIGESINRKILIRNLIIINTILILLVLVNITMYNSETYIKFTEIGTIGVLWTIIGFAFTIYCFISPKLSKTIIVMNKLENCLGTELYYNILQKKGYYNFKKIELMYDLLKIFIFSSLAFLLSLTYNALCVNEFSESLQILINIASNLLITNVAITYITLIFLAQYSFDATKNIDDDKLEELKKAAEKMEQWSQEETKPTKNKKNKNHIKEKTIAPLIEEKDNR